MQAQLLLQGVELMVVGMGTVFVFLTLLVIATTLMSRLVLRTESRAFLPAESPMPANAPSPADSPSPTELAAIAAAVTAFREHEHKDES